MNQTSNEFSSTKCQWLLILKIRNGRGEAIRKKEKLKILKYSERRGHCTFNGFKNIQDDP